MQTGAAERGRRPARAPTTWPGWSGSTCYAARAVDGRVDLDGRRRRSPRPGIADGEVFVAFPPAAVALHRARPETAAPATPGRPGSASVERTATPCGSRSTARPAGRRRRHPGPSPSSALRPGGEVWATRQGDRDRRSTRPEARRAARRRRGWRRDARCRNATRRGFSAGDMVRSLFLVIVLVLIVLALTVRSHPKQGSSGSTTAGCSPRPGQRRRYDVLAPIALPDVRGAPPARAPARAGTPSPGTWDT